MSKYYWSVVKQRLIRQVKEATWHAVIFYVWIFATTIGGVFSLFILGSCVCR